MCGDHRDPVTLPVAAARKRRGLSRELLKRLHPAEEQLAAESAGSRFLRIDLVLEHGSGVDDQELFRYVLPPVRHHEDRIHLGGGPDHLLVYFRRAG